MGIGDSITDDIMQAEREGRRIDPQTLTAAKRMAARMGCEFVLHPNPPRRQTMTEPSEPSTTAYQKAYELANAAAVELEWCSASHGGYYSKGEFTAPIGDPAKLAFARYIQTTSDVAKRVRGFIDRNSCNSGAPDAMAAVKSLILPDEPCWHILDKDAVRLGVMRCDKCGCSLKIVQSDD